MKRAGSKNLLLTHGSDIEKAAVITALQAQRCEAETFFNNDYSEWDTRYILCFMLLTHTLLGFLGIPKELNDYFLEFRRHWKMIYHRGKTANASLTGEEKQITGNPLTLYENTNGNMALTNYLYEFVSLVYGLYMGDDNSTKCRRAILRDKGAAFLAISKHKLKAYMSDVGDFAGFIISKHYAGPDLFRRTTKFLGALYRDADHFNATKINAVAAPSIIKSEHQLREIALATSLHYGMNVISPAQVEQLYHFLRNTAPNMQFSDLQKLTKFVRQSDQ
jgi:hypothetical protein